MDLPEECQKFIDENSWVYAKTMPDSPHAYVVRNAENEDGFVRFAEYIRKNGFEAYYEDMPQKFTYYDHAGYRYWTMGNPIPETTVINRCSTDLYEIIEEAKGTTVRCRIRR